MEENQTRFVSDREYLNEIISTKEASEIMGITQGYLRTLILAGEFKSWEYKKVGKSIVLLKNRVLARKDKFKGNKK
jgi:hypothetical protein